MEMLTIVNGNLARIGIRLKVCSQEVVNGQVSAASADFYPDGSSPVIILLAMDSLTYRYEAEIVNGNVAVFEDRGVLPVGTYTITVLARDLDGNPYRYKKRGALSVVDCTCEAGVITNTEGEVQLQYLDAALFLVAGGIGGSFEQAQADWDENDINSPSFIKNKPVPDSAMSDSSENAVQNKIVKEYVDSVSSRLDALISEGNVAGVIDTFNEIKAFLVDFTESDSLVAQLALKYSKPATGIPKSHLEQAVQNSLDAADTAYQKPSTGIPADHIAPGVIPDVSGKVDKVPGKGLSTEDYTSEEKQKLAGIANGAKVNVQADWNETDSSSDSFIKNKPVPDSAMSDSSENAVQNKIVKAYIDAVSLRLDTLIGSGNVQGAIDTFNEVTAFLNGIDTDDPTLANQLLALNNAITALQTTLSSKANDNAVVKSVTINGSTQTPQNGNVSFTLAGGQDGEDGVGFDSVTSAQDGTMVITLSNGDTMTIDLKHNHPQYLKAELKTQAEYDALTTKDSQTLYIITDAS